MHYYYMIRPSFFELYWDYKRGSHNFAHLKQFKMQFSLFLPPCLWVVLDWGSSSVMSVYELLIAYTCYVLYLCPTWYFAPLVLMNFIKLAVAKPPSLRCLCLACKQVSRKIIRPIWLKFTSKVSFGMPQTD